MNNSTVDIQDRTKRLREALTQAGACLVGFADVSILDTRIVKEYPFGICFALRYDSPTVDKLPADETFITMNRALSNKAERLYNVAVGSLDAWGFRHTRVSSGTPADDLPDLCEELPQKTLATLSGLGWVGRSSLLVSPDYGPRIRLGAMLTDCPLEVDRPMTKRSCEDCTACVDACPVNAIRGLAWRRGLSRADLLDAEVCYSYLQRDKQNIGRKYVCGLCVKVCPVGRV